MNTVVLLCEDLAKLGAGLDLDALRSSLEADSSAVAVEIVPDICGHPARIVPAIRRHSAERAVLGLCSGKHAHVELQSRMRKAGLDPFGVELIALGTMCSQVHAASEGTQKARALLAAAVARARAYEGSGPEHAKAYFMSRDQKVTRRSLFSVPPIGYRPVPSIRGVRCAAGTGCRLCVESCPRDALRASGEAVVVDKVLCQGCGGCVAACPRDAVDFPGWALSQFEAQLDVLLDATSGTDSPGILLTCQMASERLEDLARADVSYSARWLPMVLPCVGMATPAWVLQALARGAGSVALLTCCADCTFGQEKVIGGRVSYCRRLLGDMGLDADRVRLISAAGSTGLDQTLLEAPYAASSAQQRGSRTRPGLGSPEAACDAIQILLEGGPDSRTVVVEHSYSPYGIVQLAAEHCTGCFACVEACPSGALASQDDEGRTTMTHTASSCIGCGTCVGVCPETATSPLALRRVTDLGALSGGTVVLHRHDLIRCEGCGAVIASRAMVRHLEGALGDASEELRAALTRHCPSCRLALAYSTEPSSPQDGERVRSAG